MATVQALLTMLQDRGKSTPASVRQVLLDLASCCRCEDAKASILTDGLGPLLALASDDQELPRGETLEVLLELLALIVLNNPEAKTKVARGGALELAVRCLHELSAGAGGGRRRAKILKRGLELVDLLSHTAESKEQERQTIVIKQILVMMIRTDDDVSVLVRATDTLGRFVDGSLQRIQVAAQEHAIAILIDLLKLVQTGESNLDLKRTVCEVLILMGEAPGMLQMMAAQNIISALCVCLRMETRAREVEFGVVRLLLRLVRDAQVYGQIVHEEMAPLLFRVIEHNSNIREVIAATCTIIADLSDFARQCKLDLSPFVKDCNGKMLVLAATCHAQEASVVDNTFRFFVNVSNNPVDLPHLINSETIEGLLSLYVLAGGSGYLAELAGHLVHVISRLSRSTLEQFTIQEEDITLPALFLCLRNYHENLRFTSQVFAILAKHWKMQCHDKSVHGITGYIGIAVEILCRTIPSSKSWKDQTADIINFIREMMLSKDGADVVMSCGGKDLLEVLHTNIDVQEDNPSTDAEMSCDHRGPSTTTPLSLSSSNFGGGRIASTVETKAFPDLDSGLTFDSNFESGNLDRAIRIGQFEYDLVLRHDFNSSGHMQWFYFATAKKYISFPHCSFKVSKDKETTARVVVANELRINWSFTLEASFCGASFGELYNMHFNTKHLREVGTALCETIFQACISDVNTRDSLLATADDPTVCIPQQVELYLREAGVIGEKYPADEEANPRSSFLKFLKGKAASVKKISNEATPKGVRRKGSKARAIATSDAGTSKATDTNEGSGIRRRLSRQQIKSTSCASGLLDRVTPDTSVPTDSTNCLDLACIPPPKLSGRKLRSKYPKVRRTKSSPDGHVKSRRRAIPSLASNAGVDNSEDSEAANDSVMPLVAPSKLSAAVSGPPSSSVRVPLSSFQGSESTYMRSSRTTPLPFPSTILGMQLRDSSVLLPSPVGDGMTRSPKAPASRIRFRGAGRQFAVVNTIPRSSIHDILRSDPVTTFQSYEADLINASTMVIRPRGSVSTTNSTAGADEKSLSPPSSNYLSFPSVM
ncbi:hypothetical protein PC121_g5636 [Phytophthora cactorum]|nr:hypothetical protein PC121_g5636 [Phytophthora cactorum]